MKKTITIAGVNIKNGAAKGKKNEDGTVTGGREWTRFGFYDGEIWYNMWGNEEQWNTDLQNAQEGDTIEICFIKKDYHGKTQYEIINPATPEIVEEEKKEGVIKELQEAIRKLTNRVELVEAQIEDI